MISRADWGARPRKYKTPITDKTGGIVVHHTASVSPVASHWPGCWDRWQAHQNYHMDTKGWSDIAYNHLVCPHGFHFEGRGWEAQNAANLPVNKETVSICWEGGLSDHPDPAAVSTINRLIGEAVDRGWAAKVRGHGEVATNGTSCPGNLRPLIADGRIGLSAPLPEPPTTGTAVMGDAEATLSQALEFVTQRSARADYPIDTVRLIVTETYRVAAEDGVRADLALGLMVKETGFFGYGGDVKADQWNFGGIGATGGVPGLRFPSITAGVKAVVRRMRMYAVDDPTKYDEAILGRPLPGSHWGRYPHIEDFNGVWAVPGDGYGQSIVALVDLMKQTVPPVVQVPFTETQIRWLDGRYVRRN